MAGGKITAYLDCMSPFSYFALVHLEKNRAVLEAHGIEIDIVPVWLHGIMASSGNKPPWSLPIKQRYFNLDTRREQHHFGLPTMTTPSFYPIISLLPQRALVYIKSTYPSHYSQVFLDIYAALFQHHEDVSNPEILSAVLERSGRFSKEEVERVLEKAKSPEVKQKLSENTKEAAEQGAFGCPWFWIRNARGEEEPVFGSDRFYYMWEFLGLPWRDVEILPPAQTAKAKI
ncbi:glutathione S-transferase kappa 1 [Bimuria novae-zelandiae CBS 107.79]|uniref:Glutathione S-transferase kappa n=1 Tax=Bimuria novae-zelandiae CBS 107.79 TaxID=1447943 RepID=A0A6A5VKP1_9PLEO|nr:glutathione S-transferase kappa 1 [Bimuria novae-zelandiae CBS 107.79]